MELTVIGNTAVTRGRNYPRNLLDSVASSASLERAFCQWDDALLTIIIIIIIIIITRKALTRGRIYHFVTYLQFPVCLSTAKTELLFPVSLLLLPEKVFLMCP